MTDDKAPGAVSVRMRAARDAVAIVRAFVADDGDEAERLLAETPSPPELATRLACMVHLAVMRLPPDLLEKYLSHAQQLMENNVLDIHLEEGSTVPPRKA